jgi:hypothetical protein
MVDVSMMSALHFFSDFPVRRQASIKYSSTPVPGPYGEVLPFRESQRFIV